MDGIINGINSNDPTSKDETIIDIHTHIIPETWPDWNERFGYGGWLTISPRGDEADLLRSDSSHFRRIQRNCWCPQTRIKDFGRLGVTRQVLSTVPAVGFNYGAKAEDAATVARFLNDHLIQTVSQHPNHFVGLGTLPMQDPWLAIQELHRIMTVEGIAGVQIGTHVNQWNLDDPALETFWAAIEETDAAVFVHPWDLQEGPRYQRHWFPWYKKEID